MKQKFNHDHEIAVVTVANKNECKSNQFSTRTKQIPTKTYCKMLNENKLMDS